MDEIDDREGEIDYSIPDVPVQRKKDLAWEILQQLGKDEFISMYENVSDVANGILRFHYITVVVNGQAIGYECAATNELVIATDSIPFAKMLVETAREESKRLAASGEV